MTVTPWLAWLATAGIAHQFPALRVGPIPGLLLTVPGFPLGDNQLQRALQATQGVELSLPAESPLTVNGFSLVLVGAHRPDRAAACRSCPPPSPPPTSPGDPPPETPYTCPRQQPLHGYAYGDRAAGAAAAVEAADRLALVHAVAVEPAGALHHARREATRWPRSPSDYDRTHVLNAVAGVRPGPALAAGAGAFLHAARPTPTCRATSRCRPTTDIAGHPSSGWTCGSKNGGRWARTGSIAFVLEGLNVTLSKETSTIGLDCIGNATPAGGTITARFEIGP